MMLAWSPGTSLKEQKGITKETIQKFWISFRCFTAEEDLLHMVTAVIGGNASGSGCVKFMCEKPWTSKK